MNGMEGQQVWIGIDPGITGAFAIMYPHVDAVEFVDMPTIQVKSGKKLKNEYDSTRILRILHDASQWGPVFVAIERQQAMPATLNGRTQGGTSTFRTGYGFGLLVGILTALRIPYELVAPVSWKKSMMADAPKDKGASILVACRLFPHMAAGMRRKKDHARADALLIIEHARRRQAS
jgi:crossover junction endodeoxyribonuclease RuvC